MAQLHVRVTPNARRSSLMTWGSDEKGRPVLLIKLAAPPIEGKANDELLRFLAELLEVPRGSLELLRGQGSRQKTLEIPDEAMGRLPQKI
jgi:uncharacterized protein (TIGR00251 family)